MNLPYSIVPKRPVLRTVVEAFKRYGVECFAVLYHSQINLCDIRQHIQNEQVRL